LLEVIWEEHLVPLLNMHKVASTQLAFKTSAYVRWARFDLAQRDHTKLLCAGLVCQSRNAF